MNRKWSATLKYGPPNIFKDKKASQLKKQNEKKAITGMPEQIINMALQHIRNRNC